MLRTPAAHALAVKDCGTLAKLQLTPGSQTVGGVLNFRSGKESTRSCNGVNFAQQKESRAVILGCRELVPSLTGCLITKRRQWRHLLMVHWTPHSLSWPSSASFFPVAAVVGILHYWDADPRYDLQCM